MKVVFSTVLLAVATFVALPASVGAQAQKSNEDALEDRIEVRLKGDASLRKFNVDADVDGTVATLTGTVATDADQARAARLAMIDGISRVDNRLVVDLNWGVKGTGGTYDKAKDGAEKVAEKTKDGAVKVAEKTKDGAVIVASKTKEGLSKTGEVITDSWITARINTDFVNEDTLKGSKIDVDTADNVVTLNGTVTSAAGRARAVAIAKGTDGVKRVVDRLMIGPKK